MASSSLPDVGQRIVSSAIVQAVAEDIVMEHFPGIEDRPKSSTATSLALQR